MGTYSRCEPCKIIINLVQVQNYIRLVGGDPTQVTAWGESAGAGSILHHITAFGGKQDPLFHKVVMQSIASEILVDRRGEVESFYQAFLNASGCAGQSLACLRSAPFATLVTANQAIITNTGPSAFKPGPAADGAWVRQMPALELASGNYYPGLTSLILSHVANEGFVFVDGEIQTDAEFANLVDLIIPAYAPTVRTDVVNFYPSPGTPGSPYTSQNDRTIHYLDDTNFLCNLRYLNNVFKGKTWTMQYSVGTAFHSDDLTPTFYNGSGAPTTTLDNLYKDYQSYLVSLSTTGNPNTNRKTTGSPATIN
jgi:carboxylesterase type B